MHYAVKIFFQKNLSMSCLLYDLTCYIRQSSVFGITTMNSKIFLFTFLFMLYVKCHKKEKPKSKKHPSLPYFRRKVEELGDADFFVTTESDDPHNLVSFLVENVKEIFDDLTTEAIDKENTLNQRQPIVFISNTSTSPRGSLSTVLIRPMLDFFTAEDIMSSSSVPTSAHRKVLKLYENLTLTTLIDNKQSSTENYESARTGLMQIAKNLKSFTKAAEFSKNRGFTLGRGNITDADGELTDPRRSCIMCSNVETEECNDPRNKLITSMMCERDDDLCYSLHTPFGIVDRGCFNINHNLTTFVCSCNLCNYISISEMPFMFAKKGDWVGNVIELSRTKNFRKSVFKEMSCLKCEVNTTTRTGDMLDSANCLEGNIGNLPVEDCDVDEICGVKALRADGYIWRGCLKVPLYNYWWTICDYDLCNYDTAVFLYDFVI